ncbi:MAG TPA: leucine-rich repeat domain-containing protein [Kofleriaceae bacterium]|nr:leucine-rich repeat domain-containing protein [Kofleriaceae bacterium]
MGIVTEREAVEAAFGRAAVKLGHARERLDGELGVYERDGHVVAISAHRLGLTAVPAIDHLAHLERVDIGGNRLVELPALPASVRELYIYDNQLERLPALPRLRVLDANRNALVELPPLHEIDFVYAASNRLAAPPVMTGCRYVNLGGNPLARLPRDPAIRELRVEDAGLTSLPASIAELVGLRELHLRGNRLTALPALPATLRVLDLRGNQLDELPDLSHLPLVKLDLRWNPLRNPPAWLDRLRDALVYT